MSTTPVDQPDRAGRLIILAKILSDRRFKGKYTGIEEKELVMREQMLRERFWKQQLAYCLFHSFSVTINRLTCARSELWIISISRLRQAAGFPRYMYYSK